MGYWDVDAALANRENDTVLKTIEEKFNVTFEPVNVTWDDYNQKFQLWASSDSLPDIFASDVRTTATFAEWANDGLLHEIPSDLSAYPNLAKYLDSPESDTCMVGDKMYCIFRQTYVGRQKRSMTVPSSTAGILPRRPASPRSRKHGTNSAK